MKELGTPYFSLIISTKDRPQDLERLFKSIDAQISPPPFEVIIVDDASSTSYAHLKRSGHHWITNEFPLGPSFNRNIAANKSNGSYLLFLDDDVILRPQNLQRLQKILSENPKLGALGGCGPALTKQNNDEVKFISVKTLRAGLNKKIFIRPEDQKHQDLFYGDHLESAYMAVPRELFFACGGFDPYWFYMGEDRDLCLSIRKKGYDIAATWSARAIHFNQTSYGTDNIAERKNIRFKRILEVSLKQFGLPYTLLQVYRERRLLMKYLNTSELLMKLKKHHSLRSRLRIDFTSTLECEKYRHSILEKEVKKEHPRNIVLFINNRCNAQCEHCFIPDLNNQSPELSYDDWLKVLTSIEVPFSLTLTGGEPLLSKNIKSFIDRIFDQTLCSYIGLLTNGSAPEQIFEIASVITSKHPSKKFKIQISLDGTRDIHNAIRKNKNSYDQAIRSGELLKEIKAKRFDFVYLATLTKNNRQNLLKLISELQDKRLKSKFTLVRGNSFSTFKVPQGHLKNDYGPQVSSLSLAPAEIRDFVLEVESKFPDFFYRQQREKIERQCKILEEKKRLYPCQAGIDEVVLYSDGSVAICEQTKSVGRLQDFDFNFNAIWNSQALLKARAATKSCACIHGCNISTGLRS